MERKTIMSESNSVLSESDHSIQMLYSTEDMAHEADLSTPLQHGVVRYTPADDLPINIRNSLPAKNDKPFIYVPVGYIHREKKDFMQNILSALKLTLPNIIVVSAESTGSPEEQISNSFNVQNKDSHSLAKDWAEKHVKEVLSAKVGRLLGSVLESSVEVGAWVLPDTPRRSNGAAQMICDAFPSAADVVALGLIGLGECDEDNFFKSSLRAAKAPLGSPIESVCSLVYDPNLIDAAPCPKLSHLIVFESPEEKSIFRQELLDLVPDFMVAFGDITDDAMQNVFDTAKMGSPVILLKHTGKNIDSLCRMFKHANKHIKSAANQDEATVRIPPIENEKNDLVRLFINTWPTGGYSSESTVLVDPLIMSSPILQKRLLGAITVAFDLKSGGQETRLIKRRALDYAWSLYEIANQHSLKKKRESEWLHVQLLFFTLFSIVVSVFYDRIYGDASHPTGSFQLPFFVCTIIVPLYVTSLTQQTNEGAAMTSWVVFKEAAYNIESEVIKFRCQVGHYRVEEKTEIALQKPVEAFTKNIKGILKTMNPYLSEDSLTIPETFWDFDAKAHLEKMEKSPLSSKQQTMVYSPPPEGLFENDPLLAQDYASPLYGDEEAPSTLKTSAGGGGRMDDSDSDDEEDSEFVDDKYCPMKADNYIEHRMQAIMCTKAKEIEKMNSRNNRSNFAIELITISSGALAAISMQWLVPVILGVTAAFGSSQSFRQYPNRIKHGNGMVVTLNELKLWWMGLSMYQKQLPQNKDHLILSAERIILHELKSTFSGSSKSED